MSTARIRFVVFFVVCAFAFIFSTTSLLNAPPGSFFGSEAQSTWQTVVSAILSPVKIVLIGPLLPFINFLHQDPDTPPPFFLAGFAVYWIILAICIHYLLARLKHS